MRNIVGSFERPEAAKAAMGRLQSAGFPADHMHLRESAAQRFMESAGPVGSRSGDPDYREHGVLQSIGDMFANLLESHTDESGIYSEALGRGSSLLVVQADSEEEAGRARQLLQEAGGVAMPDLPDRAGGPARGAAGGGAAGEPARKDPGRRGNVPLGTHSFTGANAAVGMPVASDAQDPVKPQRDLGGKG